MPSMNFVLLLLDIIFWVLLTCALMAHVKVSTTSKYLLQNSNYKKFKK